MQYNTTQYKNTAYHVATDKTRCDLGHKAIIITVISGIFITLVEWLLLWRH